MICQVEKQAKDLAEVIATHHCEFTVHIRVVVKNLQQIAHLQERFLVAKDSATTEGGHNLLNRVLRIRALSESLQSIENFFII